MAGNCFAASPPLPPSPSQLTSMTQRYVCGCYYCRCCLPPPYILYSPPFPIPHHITLLPISLPQKPQGVSLFHLLFVVFVFCLLIRFLFPTFFLLFAVVGAEKKTVLLQANADRRRSFYTFSLSFYCLPLPRTHPPATIIPFACSLVRWKLQS